MTDRWKIVVGVWLNKSRNPFYDEGINMVSQAEIRSMVSADGGKCTCQNRTKQLMLAQPMRTTSAFRKSVRET